MEFRSGRVAEENTISSKGIRKKVKNSESVALKRIGNYDLLDLSKVLDDVYSSSRPISAEYETRKELVKNLNAMALEIYGDSKESSPVLEAYGSFVMNMFSSQSDLDVSINFEKATSELPRQKKVQILRTFAEKLQSLQGQGHVRNVKPILGARVPIVKFVDQGTDVTCDLSVGNKDGILNSQIIHIISQIDDRFHKLCMLVKHWAKAHEVNSAPDGTLNSISITALVAHHLQTQDPPILPPLSVLFKDGTDPVNVEKRTQKFLKWGQRNKESLGRLFVTFFVKLQSIEFLWRQGLCVSSLSGLWISKKWKKSSINVEDFLDVSQNLARTVNGEGAKEIYVCINRTVENIFEFLNGKLDGLHLRDILFRKQADMESRPPPPPPPSRHPLVLPSNVYTQQPHNDYVKEENDRHEIHRNKRVCLVNGYKAVETDYIREEERYENLRKRIWIAGFGLGFPDL
uniref:Poly(A) RNA polymerase cid11 n=1 Tax=Noccaea caerulescens TaxID=107243 RepID=A0A1J3IHD8_NOCCA